MDTGTRATASLPARTLADALTGGWKPENSILVLTGPRHGTLTEQDRDRVWRQWGVPVYEQLLDADGNVVAEECDAHDGLHVILRAACTGSVETRQCGCGISGPMIDGSSR